MRVIVADVIVVVHERASITVLGILDILIRGCVGLKYK